jgi:hypothetical protein
VRDAYARLVAQGGTDALRELHAGERIYTFWDYLRNAFGRNAGLRIDHLLLSPALAPRLKSAGVDRDARAREKPSDHAPPRSSSTDAGLGTGGSRGWPGPWPAERRNIVLELSPTSQTIAWLGPFLDVKRAGRSQVTENFREQGEQSRSAIV